MAPVSDRPHRNRPSHGTNTSLPYPLVRWTVHLAARRQLLSAAVGLALIVVAGLVGWAYRSPVFGALALVVLFGSTATYWLPRRYDLHPDRIEIRHLFLMKTVSYPLSRYRAFYRSGNALFLSPTGRSDGIARYRGLTLFLPNEPDEIVRFFSKRFE
ncbi:MAG: hypothetical protein O3A46_06230 [Candidatus Poribacteria bacterium]|nr:hypothetical protein [Candidatus Poribacteria bacterium]